MTKPIDISIQESINGITVSLAFSISPEALMREIQAETLPCGNPHNLFEDQEKLIQAIYQEVRTLLAQERLKLLTCLLSSFCNLYKRRTD